MIYCMPVVAKYSTLKSMLLHTDAFYNDDMRMTGMMNWAIPVDLIEATNEVHSLLTPQQ